MYPKKENIYPAYVSKKKNPNREKLVILLMISNGEGRWNHLPVKRGIIFKH